MKGKVIPVFGIEFVEKKLKIDDPVGAVGVHGLCGALGTIMVGFFSLENGLLYGHGFKALSVQLLGVVCVIAWVSITMTLVFSIIKKTVGLRVSEAEELVGLDLEEHGLRSSYADFMPSTTDLLISRDTAPSVEVLEPTIQNKENKINDKLTKISVIINQNQFEALKVALDSINITGLTVTHVLGYGIQKGRKEFYRGVAVDTTLLPKVKLEIVVCSVPVDLVVKTIKSVLYTGKVGDGKIFIYDVENVIKVRTGQEGYYALKDED